MRLPTLAFPIHQDIVADIRDSFGIISRRIIVLPCDLSDKIYSSKYLVTNKFEVIKFVIIYTDENGTIICKQLLQQSQSRIHHAEPFVVTREILAFLADDFTEPFLDLRVVHVVVVNPSFVSGIVRRIDVDALDPAFILRQKRLERGKIVAVDNHVLIVGM